MMSRRHFIKIALGVVASVPALAAYARYGEPDWIEVRRQTIAISGLDPALKGLTIALLTDLHLSKEVSFATVMHAITLTLAQRPDLIALGGDYISEGSGFVAKVVEAVAQLSAPLGVYAVLGNRDHSSDVANRLTQNMTRTGIRVLRNESVSLTIRGAPVHIIGVDSVLMRRADPAAAFRGLPAEGMRLLLVHEPDFADHAAQYRVDLQLSGHSHGGQVRLPFVGPIKLPSLGRRYPEGLRRTPTGATQVYTSRGIGLIAPAIRFNCRPEIAILTLIPA